MEGLVYPFGLTSWSLRSIAPGMIVSWQGSIETIPDGWALCDGSEGRPDLRNIFVVAAGGAYDPGDEDAGIVLHRHTFTSDGHRHDMQTDGIIDSGPGRLDYLDIKAATGTTGYDWSPPPYYSLAFIVKL